ncbi:MAG: DUF3822 family protein [Prevotellaceae bacterium]|jgi:hypothetical protein|nr:DUF3822 family protein [Prevotellaceae bacterium]
MLEKKSDKSLLIFCHTDCALWLADTSGNTLLQQQWTLDLWRSNEEDFLRVLAQATEIRHMTENIRIVCQSEHFAFVPLALFSPHEARYFLDFQEKTDDAAVCSNILGDREIAAVFAVPQSLVKAMSRFAEKTEITLHLTEIMRHKHSGDSDCVRMWIAQNSFDVLVFEKNRLKFYNSFKFGKKEDIMYFMTAIFEQLSLNFQTTEIFVYNAENKKDTLDFLRKSFVVLPAQQINN